MQSPISNHFHGFSKTYYQSTFATSLQGKMTTHFLYMLSRMPHPSPYSNSAFHLFFHNHLHRSVLQSLSLFTAKGNVPLISIKPQSSVRYDVCHCCCNIRSHFLVISSKEDYKTYFRDKFTSFPCFPVLRK